MSLLDKAKQDAIKKQQPVRGQRASLNTYDDVGPEAKSGAEKSSEELWQEGIDEQAMRAPEQNEIRTFTANGMQLPAPPKPGEVMKCLYCGKEMPPKSFPKNKTMRRLMFKWHICEPCYMTANDMCDKSTHRLLAERKGRR